MKKFIIFICIFLSINLCAFAEDNSDILSIEDLNNMGIVANSTLKKKDLDRAKNLIMHMNKRSIEEIEKGYGPFMAIISNQKGIIFSQVSNSVVKDKSSLAHAEIDAIRETQKKLGAYDLTPFHLSIYVTSEPCLMCMGAIMWSGIENVYYGVPTQDVVAITGFDEGFKSDDWMDEFKKRNINVYGNIESDLGKDVLLQYMKTNKEMYKPKRTPDNLQGQKLKKNEFSKLSTGDKYRKFNKKSLLSKADAREKKEHAEYAQETRSFSHKKYVKKIKLTPTQAQTPAQSVKIAPQKIKIPECVNESTPPKTLVEPVKIDINTQAPNTKTDLELRK